MYTKNRFFATMLLVACVAVCASATLAEIRPPQGDYPLSPGVSGKQCIILCEEISLREKPSFDASIVDTFAYGTQFTTSLQHDGWINFVSTRDGSSYNWVRAEYVLIDPAFYITEKETPVYAYDGADSLRIALLDADMELPIIKETSAGYFVSLRSASGFIRK